MSLTAVMNGKEHGKRSGRVAWRFHDIQVRIANSQIQHAIDDNVAARLGISRAGFSLNDVPVLAARYNACTERVLDISRAAIMVRVAVGHDDVADRRWIQSEGFQALDDLWADRIVEEGIDENQTVVGLERPGRNALLTNVEEVVESTPGRSIPRGTFSDLHRRRMQHLGGTQDLVKRTKILRGESFGLLHPGNLRFRHRRGHRYNRAKQACPDPWLCHQAACVRGVVSRKPRSASSGSTF